MASVCQVQTFAVDSFALIEAGSDEVVATLSDNSIVTIDPDQSYGVQHQSCHQRIGRICQVQVQCRCCLHRKRCTVCLLW